MGPVLQFHRLASQQPEVGLVDQGCALQGVIRPLGSEVIVREAPQLLVDQGHESAKGLFVALFPVTQKLSDLTGLIFGHGRRLPLSGEVNSIFARSTGRQSTLILARWRDRVALRGLD
jgi:hypothetical protein